MPSILPAPRPDAISRFDARLLRLATVALPLAWLALHVGGMRRCLDWLQARAGVLRADVTRSDFSRAAHVAAVAQLAAAYAPAPVTCLSRSLVLVWLLQREGIRGELRIGARVAGAVLSAHAWVEVADIPINDERDVALRFPPFAARHAR